MVTHPLPSGEPEVRYRLPRALLASLAWSVLSGGRRSLAADAARAVASLALAPLVFGGENVPRRGPCLLVCNHYTRPGFGAWWHVCTLSAALAGLRAPGADAAPHWVMTAAWTFPDSAWRRRYLTPISRWVFGRVAATYGFVTMPPMPPDPGEVAQRAASVRRALVMARNAAREGGILALAPEGRDFAGGLGQPPPGAGEFISLLVAAGLPVLPAGLGEIGGRLHLCFGPVFLPPAPKARADRDAVVIGQVMSAIARCLPAWSER